jgi:hypothetical protein
VLTLKKKIRDLSNKWTNDAPQDLRKTRKSQTQISERKEVIKIKIENSEMESKRTIQRINWTKNWFLEKIAKLIHPLYQTTKKTEKNPN